MLDLHTLQPEDALREFMAERHRRFNTPSLAGIEPDSPRGTSLPSGRYETLIQLTRNAPVASVELEYIRFTSRANFRNVPWGSPKDELTIAVAVPFDDVELAEHVGWPVRVVRMLHAEVLRAVSENLGRLRGNTRGAGEVSERAQLLALARSVL